MNAGAHIERVIRVYQASDGEATRALYAQLATFGARGALALNLFRACKSSERAKVYRGGGYRGAAYDRKGDALDQITLALFEIDRRAQLGEGARLVWGWGRDDKQPFHKDVLYIDLPTGQVSFHAAERGLGPAYPGQWDGVRNHSVDRITRYVARLLAEHVGAPA